MEYPKQGDIMFIDAEPHAGVELGGHDNIRRPIVVLSSSEYNRSTGLISGMPITSHNFMNGVSDGSYVPIADKNSGIKGNIVTYYLPSYDFEARKGEIVGHVSDIVLKKLLDSVRYLFDI
ncbi:type II toxin-antitoxin system PemK/MazF family toxin [Companilactobacillus kedongensis]|uniref:type II toxin-antitoxin system PemK/MazF family toxin n=1 Tax=Companilactobacillus kedongensis TaxID=2486004 RepID=UPI000F7801DA|nr:type II toxin-antitoxin system PemK/MazF family toxin [Companilactobacillus kedongensis]